MRKATVWIFLLLVAFALAVTPAGTEIRNQASASYVDSAGQPRTTTSNEVVTVVQPVYGFTITPNSDEDNGAIAPGQSQQGLPGGKVYFPYTITNTANTTDTINLSVATPGTGDTFVDDPEFTPVLSDAPIYLDENCNGQIDAGETTVSSVELAMGDSACVIVEASIPDSGVSEGDNGYLNLEGTSEGDSNITDTDNWAEAVATEEAIVSATKSASPSGSVAPDSVITYTIEGANIGGSDACAAVDVVDLDGSLLDGVLIYDDIPNGTTYELGSASGEAGAGNARVIYYIDDDNDPNTLPLKTDDEDDIDDPAQVVAVALLIEAPTSDDYDAQTDGPFFPQGAQYTFTFSVKVDAGLAAGTLIPNQASAVFDADCDGTNDEILSNTTNNDVAPSYGVLNGPQGDPDADSNGFDSTYTDPSGKDWEFEEITGTGDGEKVSTTVYSGDTVYFPFTLQNTGNTDDSFDLSIDDDTSSIPDDWTCQIVAADGTTPISGAVGPLAPQETYDYIVKCAIPATYTESDSNVNAAEISVKAQSTSDPNVFDYVKGIVPDVLSGYEVDVAKPGSSGDDDQDNDNPDPVNAVPGESVQIPFEVANTGQKADTYDLEVTKLPTNWNATIYPEDCDGDGVLDDPPPPPVSDTGLIEAGEKKCFILVVDVPEDQGPVSLDSEDDTDNNVEVTATSNADGDVSDSISTDVNVAEVYDLSFTPDRSGTVTSPGTIVYDHTVTNNGNVTTDVKFTTSGGREGWTYQISTDGGDTWVAASDASIDDLAAGASQVVKVRVIVPDGEAIGTVDAIDVEAVPYTEDGTTQKEDATPDDNVVTDTTTIVGGDLRLEKSVDKTEALPEDILTYTVVASNIGTGDLKQVIISDPVPAYTEYVGVSATAEGFDSGQVLYSKDGSTWYENSSDLGTDVSIVYVAVDTDDSGTITEDDVMPPGAKITMEFQVKVK